MTRVNTIWYRTSRFTNPEPAAKPEKAEEDVGYQTDFTGILRFTRPMTLLELAYIEKQMGFDLPDDLKGYIYPHGKPHYVQLEVSNDKSGIQWDGNEKFYEAVNAVNFVIDNARREIPDFGLSGQLEAQGEEIGDHWFLVIGEDGYAKRVDAPKIGDKVTCPNCDHEFALDNFE